jgi:hypothetical protein
MDTRHVFIRFCESIEGRIDGLAESINFPSLSDPDNRGTEVIPAEKAESILGYHDKFRHNPDTETPLKNGDNGERNLSEFRHL